MKRLSYLVLATLCLIATSARAEEISEVSARQSELSVTILGTVKNNAVGAKQIDFGDGAVEGIAVPCGAKGMPECPLTTLNFSQSHTYAKPGNYLVKITNAATGAFLIQVPVTATPIAATFTPRTGPEWPVRDFAFAATPSTGKAPLEVTFSCSKQCHEVAGKRIHFGDGESGMMVIDKAYSCGPDASCVPPTFLLKHTYKKPGIYMPMLMDAALDTDCAPNAQCVDPVLAKLEMIIE